MVDNHPITFILNLTDSSSSASLSSVVVAESLFSP